MLRVAVIFSGSPYKQSGKFNHVLLRAKEILKQKDVEVDVYLIQKEYSKLYSALKKKKVKKENTSIVNSVKLHNIWVKEGVTDYLLVHKARLKSIMNNKQIKKHVDLFENYDVIATNDLLSSYLALLIKEEYNIPFSITWHGSDINVYPYRSKYTFKLIKSLMQSANNNFFVSKYLLEKSDQITKLAQKQHLYIGANQSFYKYPDKERIQLREDIGITTNKVVGFVGNIEPIKNVMLLPQIFRQLQEGVKNISFVIVGDGRQLSRLKLEVSKLKVKNTFFLGRITPQEIPDVMNTLDVLILPSENEGLPLVCIEAQKCGVHVVGSKVGGIPEVIPESNCFKLDTQFNENIVKRINDIFKDGFPLEELSSEFSIVGAIEKEIKTFYSIVKK